MPGPASRPRFRPKREFKRGFWWTLGAVAAYAVVAGGVALVLTRLRDSIEVVPTGRLEPAGGCATGECPEAWAK